MRWKTPVEENSKLLISELSLAPAVLGSAFMDSSGRLCLPKTRKHRKVLDLDRARASIAAARLGSSGWSFLFIGPRLQASRPELRVAAEQRHFAGYPRIRTVLLEALAAKPHYGNIREQ
jgi:hypothetical protein